MKKVLGCLLAAAGANLAAGAESVTLAPTPYVIPARIGPLVYKGEPHRFPQPGLGVGYSYSAPGMALDIYIYDAEQKGISDGAESSLVCREFQGVKDTLLQYQDYGKITLKSVQMALLDPPGQELLAREAVFEFEFKDQPKISYLWLTAGAANLIKLRFTAVADLRDELADARRAILSALGEGIKPHYRPVAVPAVEMKEGGISIVVNSGGKDEDRALGLAYLMSLATSLEDDSAVPTCSGPLIPSYATELAAFQSTATISAQAKGRTRFDKRLRAIADAGFLEEFVWLYRHRDNWGENAPESVEIDKFKPWALKNLKRFEVPDFGYIDVPKGRDLSIETAP